MSAQDVIDVIAVIGALVLGAIVGGTVCIGQVQKEAIRAGVAEYVITKPESGETEFRYKSVVEPTFYVMQSSSTFNRRAK